MRNASDLRQRAERYRGMRRQISDPRAVQAMCELASEYEMTAAELELRCRIRERARQIWIERGRPEGRDIENWLEAEREMATGQQNANAEPNRSGRYVPQR
jgi:Protein of unknown function (DUF2934)